MTGHFDCFISFKYSAGDETTPDYRLAFELFDRLRDRGVRTFFAPESVTNLANSDYGMAIDDALDSASVMVVVATSADNVMSQWVRYEWQSFLNDVRSGIKQTGHVFTLTDRMRAMELPRALRQQQNYSSIDIGRLRDAVVTSVRSGHAGSSGAVEPTDSDEATVVEDRLGGFLRSPTIEDCGDLVRAYASRSRAGTELRLGDLVAESTHIAMSGISLNFLCQQFPSEQLGAMVQAGASVQALFLQPGSEAMEAREREENYELGRLSTLTELNISILSGIREQLSDDAKRRFEIRTSTEPVRCNLVLLDGRFCMYQPYLPGTRGLDSPTFVFVRRAEDGLFDTMNDTFSAYWRAGQLT